MGGSRWWWKWLELFVVYLSDTGGPSTQQSRASMTWQRLMAGETDKHKTAHFPRKCFEQGLLGDLATIPGSGSCSLYSSVCQRLFKLINYGQASCRGEKRKSIFIQASLNIMFVLFFFSCIVFRLQTSSKRYTPKKAKCCSHQFQSLLEIQGVVQWGGDIFLEHIQVHVKWKLRGKKNENGGCRSRTETDGALNDVIVLRRKMGAAADVKQGRYWLRTKKELPMNYA